MFTRPILLGLLVTQLPLVAADQPATPAKPVENTPAASGSAGAAPAAEAAKPVSIAATEEAALKAAVGQLATVTGKVTRANAWEGGITFLNFDGAFTAVCFKKHYAAFPTPPEEMYAAGKTLEVTGKLSLHKGKVQIEITSPDQVKVVESPAPSPAPTGGPAAPAAPESKDAPAAAGEKPAQP